MSRAIPPHGHHNRYAYGCRCTPCTKAASRADAERRLDRMAGRPRKVPAGPVREHILKLLERGLSMEQIDRESAVSVTTVRRLINGQANLSRANAEKILRVPLTVRVSLGDVPALGAMRRVRALYALGHFNWEIAKRAGVSRDTVSYLAAGKWQTLKVGADNGIRAAYDQLSMRTGSSTKTRLLAERQGWAPPLAWDDDTIDAPAAVPDLGEEVPRFVELAENGFELEQRQGYTREQAAERLGVTKDALQKSMDRYRAAQSEPGASGAYVTRERIMTQNQMEEAA
ncbi:helix-turn-helix transcriptional regulator [Streptomyces sp. NPDC052052]|uniref:helix-turn-helix domain-containing protein n=1 Tax=Streptomyces sp. NPDC052052 TaxID=3154756 RepID=UPI0034289959